MVYIIYYIFIIVNCDNVKEPWVNYQQLPYGNINTGAGTLESNVKV